MRPLTLSSARIGAIFGARLALAVYATQPAHCVHPESPRSRETLRPPRVLGTKAQVKGGAHAPRR